MAKGELGFGLESLFDDNSAEVQVKRTLRISEIEPNRNQPRKFFSDEGIEALADSIREHGVLQPILVRPLPDGSYQIVAGERRWRASKMAGLDEVPVNIKELDDFETMKIAMAENLQRENLNPIEEAEGYKYLIDNFNMTKEQIAKIAGKSRSYISNSIRILSLPDFVTDALREGLITAGHAKALLMFDDEKLMTETAEKAILEQLDEIIKGNFSDEDIQNILVSIENSFSGIGDTINSYINWYKSAVYEGEYITPEKKLEEYRNVTRERIIECAKSLVLDTVYIMKSREE